MGGLEAPAPWQALRLCPGGFPEAQGRVSPAQTGPGRIAVDRSPADNQQPPPRHLDQGCALPRTGAEAGGGSLCPFYRQGAPPPTPAVQKASRDSGVCARRERDSAHPASGKAPQKVQPSPQSATAGVGGGVGQCSASGPLITQNSSAASPRPPPAGPGTRTLRSSWGGCASLNPLPTLTQSPPEASAAWAGAPTPTSPSRAGGLTAARQALAQSTDGSHGRCPRRPHPTCKSRRAARVPRPRRAVTALHQPVALGGVRAWAPDGWVCAGVGAGPRML